MAETEIKALSFACAIIDDEPLSCMRLKDILKGFDTLEVKGIYQTYQDAHDHLLSSRPQIIFLDVELDQNHTAFELIEVLHSNCYFPYIIMVTAYEHYSIKAIKKSVFDYLVKPIDIDELKETLNRLQKHISAPFSTLFETHDDLSEREKEVLELVMKGNTSQEIADLLYLSKNTIDSHRKNILKKTGASSISELIRMSSPNRSR